VTRLTEDQNRTLCLPMDIWRTNQIEK